ncbi:MAG: hypothetical protein GXP08_09870 [Gammaproteobacteria bacterium]|nr:hypothetical protein [Gammaproteobacteria bacterium]
MVQPSKAQGQSKADIGRFADSGYTHPAGATTPRGPGMDRKSKYHCRLIGRRARPE